MRKQSILVLCAALTPSLALGNDHGKTAVSAACVIRAAGVNPAHFGLRGCDNIPLIPSNQKKGCFKLTDVNITNTNDGNFKDAVLLSDGSVTTPPRLFYLVPTGATVVQDLETAVEFTRGLFVKDNSPTANEVVIAVSGYWDTCSQ